MRPKIYLDGTGSGVERSQLDELNPSCEDIQVFIDIFNKLSNFEAQHRFLRKWGIFSEKDQLPNPSVVRVMGWLKKESENGSR
jgi:hypothetical protein